MSDIAHPVSDVMHRIWISAILFGARKSSRYGRVIREAGRKKGNFVTTRSWYLRSCGTSAKPERQHLRFSGLTSDLGQRPRHLRLE